MNGWNETLWVSESLREQYAGELVVTFQRNVLAHGSDAIAVMKNVLELAVTMKVPFYRFTYVFFPELIPLSSRHL